MIFGEIIGSCSVFSPATTGIAFEESSDLVTDSPGPPFPAANHPNCKTVAGDRECCLFRVYCVEAWKCGSVEVWKCRSVFCGSVEVWKCIVWKFYSEVPGHAGCCTVTAAASTLSQDSTDLGDKPTHYHRDLLIINSFKHWLLSAASNLQSELKVYMFDNGICFPTLVLTFDLYFVSCGPSVDPGSEKRKLVEEMWWNLNEVTGVAIWGWQHNSLSYKSFISVTKYEVRTVK